MGTLKSGFMGDAEGRRAVTSIAIDRDKNSQFAVKWAVENLLKKTSSACVLVHVQTESCPPGGVNFAVKGGRPPNNEEVKQLFLPYRGFFARKGVEAKEVVLQDADVPRVLIDFIIANCVTNIVVGASTRNALTSRKFKNPDVPASLIKAAPESCSVYVVGKSRLHNHRAASQPATPLGSQASKIGFKMLNFLSEIDPNSRADTPDSYDLNRSTCSIESYRSESSESTYSGKSRDSLPPTSYGSRKPVHRSPRPMGTYISRKFSESSSSDISDRSNAISFRSSSDMSFASDIFAQSSDSEHSLSSFASQNSVCMETEMAKLQLEFKQSLHSYNMACRDAEATDYEAKDLQRMQTTDAQKPEQLDPEEQQQWSLPPGLEKRQRSLAALPPTLEGPQVIQQRTLMEPESGESFEAAGLNIAERNTEIESIANIGIPYKKYSIREIEKATDCFSEKLKIGEGGYGPVYKATLDYMPVAIKVLRSNVSQGLRQFKQEVEVLSCIRHPNMVLLVGACPEYGCLIYEYMDNGCLEDRLFCKNGTPPIPWRYRFAIAAEIAAGLFFLHQTKPEPLVHRDIKPSNILLDRHYASKISDVGLARLVPASVANRVTEYHMTAAAGTFCYIDPEYQQTGMLGVKSDVYSFGVMLLQILTGRPPMGLAMVIEEAIENGTFYKVLDPTVKGWPYQEALSMAKMALRCCELRRRDRPDLGTEVLPELNRLKNIGMADEVPCDLITDAPSPYTSNPDMESEQSQITVRGRWRRFKAKTRAWTSFKRLKVFPSRQRQVQGRGMTDITSCWSSIVPCSAATPKLDRFMSFS
ncbi:hypothetical protein MLD38_004813 [Melastoma candidum]|uniref:Uncharacterized protein n=1 Tax=Melastoma candidum TaxID=119954 RepID=A0ACB9S6E8_9MYRT|nr:hypothetical protein MLD38_004813 [Melastoma candidum]